MQTIELRGDENITAIRSLLERAEQTEVLLVVPKGCEALENSKVNLALLRRWADNLALLVGLAIENRSTQVLAKSAGFIVFPSVEQGQGADLRLLDRRRRTGARLPPRPTLSLLPLPSAHKPRAKAGPQRFLSSPAGLLSASAAFLFLLLVLLAVVAPSATVTLQPVTEPVQATMQIAGIAGLEGVNYEQAQVPARSVYVEREALDTIATTNKRDIPDGHAQGTVVFANRTSIPITITKGTVVRTSFGENVRFYTMADAGVPGQLYATARVGILAAEPGPAGNVAPLTINVVEGEVAAQVDVLNDGRASGGTVRRVSTVDGVDKVNLRAKLSRRIQEEAYSELTAALDRREFIPPDSLATAVLEEAFDHKVDDVTDQLGLTMRVRVSGLAVNGSEAEKLMLGLLEQRMKPGYRLLADSATFDRGEVISASAEEALFTMTVQAAIAPIVDARALSAAISGKSVEEAKRYLLEQLALVEEPEIRLQTSPLRRLPFWAPRIRVQVATG